MQIGYLNWLCFERCYGIKSHQPLATGFLGLREHFLLGLVLYWAADLYLEEWRRSAPQTLDSSSSIFFAPGLKHYYSTTGQPRHLRYSGCFTHLAKLGSILYDELISTERDYRASPSSTGRTCKLSRPIESWTRWGATQSHQSKQAWRG